MARSTRSESVFFRYEGTERKHVFFRINPSAVRFQQGAKGGTTETLGGYFREILYSADPQYNGLALPELTIEATSGIAYRKELEEIQWIWKHRGDRKPDGSPADLYFFDLTNIPPVQGIVRDSPRAYLIDMQNFAWDDTVSNAFEMRFTMRCKVLRDLFGELEVPSEAIDSTAIDPALTGADSIEFGTIFLPDVVF